MAPFPRLSLFQRGCFAAAALLLALACGGGGGGGNDNPYSVSVSPGQIAFAAEAGAPLPAPQSLHASFRGDGLLVGYPQGTIPPDWLFASMVSSDTTSATVSAQPNTTALPAGTYTTTLRFITGKSDGSKYVIKDVPVSYHVTSGLQASPSAFSFTTSEGVAPADQTLTLSSDTNNAAWTLTVEPVAGGPTDWLSASATSGATATTLHIRAAARARGSYAASLVLKNAAGLTKAQIPVTYEVSGVYDLVGTLAATLNQASIPGDLDLPLQLQTHLGAGPGAAEHWQISSDQPWLSFSPATGNLGASTAITAHIDAALMSALGNGSHGALVNVHVTGSGYSDLSRPFNLQIYLPTVTHVAPYTTWVGQTNPVVLRGSYFPATGTVPVRFGSSVVTGTVVSDTEIHVTPPSLLAAGRFAVSIDNALGAARPGSELVVLPQPGYAEYTLTLPKNYAQMILDPERQAVLLQGYSAGNMGRLRFANGAWAFDSYDALTATGAAVTQDGKDLLITAGWGYTPNQIRRVDPETFVDRDVLAVPGYYTTFSLIAGFNDGRTLLLDSDQWCDTLWYPAMTSGPSPMIHGAAMLMTRDRSRIILHTTTSSTRATVSLDVNDAAYQSVYFDEYINTNAWGISGDGHRHLKEMAIYDHAFQKLGTLTVPETEIWSAAVSPDGAWAYTFGRTAADPSRVLRRTNITGASGPYATSDVLAFHLPEDEYPNQIRVSEDGGTLFILCFKNLPGYDYAYVFHAFPLS